MTTNGQKLALIPMTDRIDAAEQLLVYESTAAKILKISIHNFRALVNESVIPYRLHHRRSKRLYFIDDLRAYARNLHPQYGKKEEPARAPGGKDELDFADQH